MVKPHEMIYLLSIHVLDDYEPEPGFPSNKVITPKAYCKHAMQWYALGARIIGGCCAIRPSHILPIYTQVNES